MSASPKHKYDPCDKHLALLVPSLPINNHNWCVPVALTSLHRLPHQRCELSGVRCMQLHATRCGKEWAHTDRVSYHKTHSHYVIHHSSALSRCPQRTTALVSSSIYKRIRTLQLTKKAGVSGLGNCKSGTTHFQQATVLWLDAVHSAVTKRHALVDV